MSVTIFIFKYKGFDILCDAYMYNDGDVIKKYHYKIYENHFLRYSSLWQDNKMWNENSVIDAAKRHIDSAINGEYIDKDQFWAKK